MGFKENNKPIYLQIAERISDSIMAGEYPPESRIPSVREYAALVQVNANTVMRSYLFLSDKGIIYNKRGIGFFIAADAKERIRKLRTEIFFNDEVKYFFSRLQVMGIPPVTLAELYAQYLATGEISVEIKDEEPNQK
ncbi:MAG: GntR family transcriptional regulator [Bacteroidales bacterium]|nr:GntR family transcriptional regulator [Bacteroidales bacterium]